MFSGKVGWGMSPLCCFFSLLVFEEADMEQGVGPEEWAEKRWFGLEAGLAPKVKQRR